MQYDNWKRYLFLYYYKNHFELITFNSKKLTPKYDVDGSYAGQKIVLSKTVIFNRTTSVADLPPIYILFIIFAAYYSNIQDINVKSTFTFQKEIMNLIEQNIENKLYNLPEYSTFFYPTFKYYFPNSRIKSPIEEIKGGYNNQYNNQRQYNNPYNQYGNPYNNQYGNPYNNQRQYNNPYNQSQYGNPYNNQYGSQYGNPYLAHKIMKKGEIDPSQIAYYITIDLELHPGTSITPEEMKQSKCRQKWNSVRKAYSEFVGKPYAMTPIYHTKTLKNKEQVQGNKTQYKRSFPQNNTRKYRPYTSTSGGKRDNTIKNM